MTPFGQVFALTVKQVSNLLVRYSQLKIVLQNFLK